MQFITLRIYQVQGNFSEAGAWWKKMLAVYEESGKLKEASIDANHC